VPQETIDELIRLDKFAASVYVPAKSLFTQEIATSVFSAYRQKRRMHNFMSKSSFIASSEKEERKKQNAENPSSDTPKKEEDQYPSLSSVFNRQRTDSFAYDRTAGGIEWK
jgi:hypothetical protein